eukprot:CAMPEP_0197439188 /NCGR_PEP_ID=MMETSP1175-20131217/5993_1 /TAXON_ID=1003142 /ORGANISM="Triceratium dubium, Strain CCMP147" /LENGTH=214 /DNA_ID=CAMNT_0042969053 /DNA_START=203 /DNA_END=847 /DNA_ORIENTATION=-
MKCMGSFSAVILVTTSLYLCNGSSAFVVSPVPAKFSPAHAASKLFMAGFGSASGSKKGKKAKKGSAPLKLKPKGQWDRYCDVLKKSTAIPVGVRVVNGEERSEWLKVGRVKSEGDEFTELAVAMQRGIIAEHAKRLLPLQVRPKDVVEWAYCEDDDDDDKWILVNKDVCDDAPTGVEKKMGFEGLPDAATGFYCHYDQGRLVDRSDESKTIAKR